MITLKSDIMNQFANPTISVYAQATDPTTMEESTVPASDSYSATVTLGSHEETKGVHQQLLVPVNEEQSNPPVEGKGLVTASG